MLSFATEQTDFQAKFKILLANGQTDQALFLLHRLKGTANNLGALTLAQTVSQLEQEIKTGGQRFSYPAFSSILEATLTDINRHVKTFAGTDESVSDHQAILQLLTDLHPFLQQQKLIPDQLIMTLQRLSQADLPGALLTRLLYQIDQIEFDVALQTIANITAYLNQQAFFDPTKTNE